MAGAHHDEIASGVRKAASTAAAGAANVLVLVKSGAGPVPRSACGRCVWSWSCHGGHPLGLGSFTMNLFYKYSLVDVECQPSAPNRPSRTGEEAKMLSPRRSET